MNREDEKYYNDYFDLFRSDGWKQLTEELTQNAYAINNVALVKDAEDLFFRQGQLEVLVYLLQFEDSIMETSFDELETND